MILLAWFILFLNECRSLACMPDIGPLEFLVRLSVAVALGALIGVERQVSHHTAGLKTNALVSTGAALFVMLAGHADQHSEAYSRIAAQIISGIGFLGGGVILRDGLHVRGLTTAATLWCAAAVGTLAGSGTPRRASMGCIAVLCVNVILKPISRKLGEDSLTGEGVSSKYRVRIVCLRALQQTVRGELLEIAETNHLILQAMKTEQVDDSNAEVSGEFCTQPAHRVEMDPLVAGFATREGVSTVEWKRTDPV
jgi:putative Mg2+ transporter-C (MgtC) family protein